jgi:hypothetical protein
MTSYPVSFSTSGSLCNYVEWRFHGDLGLVAGYLCQRPCFPLDSDGADAASMDDVFTSGVPTGFLQLDDLSLTEWKVNEYPTLGQMWR